MPRRPQPLRVARRPSLDGRHDARPDWVQANPAEIDRAVRRASALPGGGWYVLGPARLLTAKPSAYTIDGEDLVVWRDRGGRLRAAPAACPHMGADLSRGTVNASGCIVCPWHGMAVSGLLPTHDDGVLGWVRLPCDSVTDAPVLPGRPPVFIAGVIRRDARCEPRDVLANRLDPWHGVHFHPQVFAHLEVIARTEESIDLVVAYRVAKRLHIEVRCRFDCSDPRTVVMTITAGEGVGSVVETHATPILASSHPKGPRTAVIEATLASSDRPGFGHALRASRLIRPVIEGLAGRLWIDDAAYAERLYSLREPRA